MSINEEKWIAHRDATQAEFDKFNEGQTPENKITVRSPFTTELPNVKFLDKKEKPYKGKNGEPDGVNVYQPIKGVDSQGSEITWKVQLPTAIAPRGYCTIKHDKGELDAIPIVLSMENPDQRLFIEQYDAKMTESAYRLVMSNPSMYSKNLASMKPIKEFTETVLSSADYKMGKMMIGMIMAQLIRKHTVNKVEVEGSPLRNMFLTPLDYKDPEKPNDPPSQMRISWKHTPGVPAVPIGLRQLYDICEGIKRDGTGKVISQKRMGFQCSGELSVSRFNIGIKLNCKSMCTALTIYTFFESKFKDSQAEKHAYVDEYVALSDMENSMNPYILEMLAGLSTTSAPAVVTASVPSGNSFNPSGVDSGSNTLPDVGGMSFLGAITAETTTVVQPVISSTVQPVSVTTPFGASSPNAGLASVIANASQVNPMQQQPSTMVPPSFGGASQFGGMPPPAFTSNGMASTSNMPPVFGMTPMSGDRLSGFNPTMIPTQVSGTI